MSRMVYEMASRMFRFDEAKHGVSHAPITQFNYDPPCMWLVQSAVVAARRLKLLHTVNRVIVTGARLPVQPESLEDYLIHIGFSVGSDGQLGLEIDRRTNVIRIVASHFIDPRQAECALDLMQYGFARDSSDRLVLDVDVTPAAPAADRSS